MPRFVSGRERHNTKEHTMKHIRIIRGRANAYAATLLCAAAICAAPGAALADATVDDIAVDGDFQQSLHSGTIRVIVNLSEEIESEPDISGGAPYIRMDHISNFATGTTEHIATYAGWFGTELHFDYNIQAGDYSSAVDVIGSLVMNGAVIRAGGGAVSSPLWLPSLIDDAGYTIQILPFFFEGLSNTHTVKTGEAKVGRELSFRIFCGSAPASDISFSVSVESDDDVAFLASDQTGAKGRISSDYGETFSTTIGSMGAMTIALKPMTETDEDATIRIHPTAMSGDGADLTIIYHGVAENVASIEKIRVLSNDDETYGADETIRLDVKFDDGISSVSGTPLLYLNVQNQNNSSAYAANNAFANYAVYNAALSSGEYMVFDYIVKPGDFVGHLDATGMNFGSGSGRIDFDTGASLDWNFPTGNDTRSLASNSSVGIRTITFLDNGSAKANISIEEGCATTLTVTRGGAASMAQAFTIMSEDASGNALENGEFISYPAFFSIPAGAESASLDITAQWAGTQCLRLHPYGYSGTDGNLLAIFNVTESPIRPSVIISCPSSSVREGDSPFTMSVSLSKAPKETITVTVSSSNTSCLKISSVDWSVGRISAGNAVIRFEAGQTGPYSVTLDPLDGNTTVYLTATADKTYSSADHTIRVLNEAPSVEVSPLNDDGEWVISGFLAMFEGIISWQVLDSAADLSAGVRYSIDWGDGSRDSGVCHSSGSGSVRHTYESARGDPEEGSGGYAIALTLTDKNGSRSTMSGRIIVNSPATAWMREYKRLEGNIGGFPYVSAATGQTMPGLGEGSIFDRYGHERHVINNHYYWRSYFLPNYGPAVFLGRPADFEDVHLATGETATHNSFFHVWQGDCFEEAAATNPALHSATSTVVIDEEMSAFTIGGVFSREYYPEDGTPDIDFDRLPDEWEEMVWPGQTAFEHIGGTDEEPYGRDDNPDGDCLPACVIGINEDGSFVVSGNDYSANGIPFYNVYEVRGTHWGLNMDKTRTTVTGATNVYFVETATYEEGADTSVAEPISVTTNSCRVGDLPAAVASAALNEVVGPETADGVDTYLSKVAQETETLYMAEDVEPKDEPHVGTYDASTFAFTDWGQENPFYPFYGTDPTKADTDADGLPDGWEYFFWRTAKFSDTPIGERRIDGSTEVIPNAEIVVMFNPCVPNDHMSIDIDGDGLTNYEELQRGTNPVRWDTDGDGFADGYYEPVQTVTLDALGGTVEPQSVIRNYGDVYGELPTPKRKGFSFNAWTLNGTVVFPSTVVSSTFSHTLTATWSSSVIPSGEDLLAAAIDNAGFADAEGVKAAIGGDFAKYAEFREWAQGVPGGDEAVVDSPHAALSFPAGRGCVVRERAGDSHRIACACGCAGNGEWGTGNGLCHDRHGRGEGRRGCREGGGGESSRDVRGDE